MRAAEAAQPAVTGFPAATGVRIVDCDDFGMCEAVNTAVVEPIEGGITSSCSLTGASRY